MGRLGLGEHAKRSAPPIPSKREPAITTKSEYGNGATNISNTNEKAIAQLAALSPLEYERQREPQANKLGCRLTTLDRLVEAGRAKDNCVLQGSAVVLPGIELWPGSVDGAQTLDDIAG